MVKRFIIFLLILVLEVSFSQNDLKRAFEKAKEEGKITLNFNSVDIREFAYFMGELINKNVIIDPAVRGKITLSFTKPLTPEEAWEVFTSALYLQGYGVIEDKDTIRILPLNEGIGIAKIKEKPAEGELSILIYSFKHTSAQDAMSAIRPFLSPFARVTTHLPSNSIIIADVGSNIQKAKEILMSLDKEGAFPTVKVYKLKYISAREAQGIINPLNTIFSKKYGTPLITSVSTEANALIVFAPEEAHRVIENIFSYIDTEEIAEEQRSFYIIPLKFISAEELYQSLQSLLTGTTRRTAYTQPGRTRQPYTGQKKQRKKQTKQPTHTQPITVITTKEGMRIGFDRGTNSVIVYATRSEYESLKKLIEELDRRRRQVLIAATIVEASTRSLLDIGVRWQIIGKRGGAVFGGSSLTEIYTSFLSGNFLLGVFSDVGKTITIGGAQVFFPDLVLLFSLLETGSGFNIISNPRVLTLDNQPAVIKVGQVIPYAEGVKFDINGQPIITYDYKEVGLELNVIPRISGNNLRLTINLNLEEIIDFVTNQIGTTSYTVPVTSNREVSADVVVENGQTVIIGGLVSTKTLRSIEGVPGLMRVPVLGRLFRRDTHQEDKTTLFIFITPYIISSPEELAKITREHQRISEELRKAIEEQEKAKRQEEELEEDWEDWEDEEDLF